MHKATLLTIVSTFLFFTPAFALPPLPTYVKEALAEKPDYAKFGEVFAGLKMKCDMCHIPKADKKAKGHGLNDFGHAMHDHLKHKEFTALHMTARANPADGKKALQLVVDALEKASAEKNAEGKVYGDLIKAGQLPGKNP